MEIDRATQSEVTSPRARISPSRSMRAKLIAEVAEARLPNGPGSRERVSDNEIAVLPEPARRFMRFMGVPGHPRIWSFRARWTGAFRRTPSEAWMPCEAWQYNTRLEVARVFHMRLRLHGVLPILVRDTYIRGGGRMRGRLFDAVSVVDQADDKIATGELVTYLNDAILFAPSMLLGAETTWTDVDDRSFDVALTDRGRTVKGRVFVDERGAVTDFSTTDRYGVDPARPGEMVRTRWSTPIRAWSTAAGRPLITHGEAVWHFQSGDFPYASFDFAGSGGELEIDVPPA
jgi:hypothetical protein